MTDRRAVETAAPTAWAHGDDDPGHARRIAVGYALGAALLGGVLLVAFSIRAAVAPPEEEPAVEVKLASEPTPPPPAPPPPEPAMAAAGPAPRKAIAAPKQIPTQAPPEAEPSEKAGPAADPYADGKGGSRTGVIGGGVPGAEGGGVVGAPAPEAPPPVAARPPAPKGPIPLPENGTAPVAVSTPQPAYPSAARSAGVEATVVVRFVVTESGEVAQPTILRGHPMFDAEVLAAVKAWRFRPALVDGRPVAVFKSVKIPFTLRM